MQNWDYLVLVRSGGRWTDDRFDGRDPAGKLSDLGKDGWELVSVCYDGSGYNFYLKKTIPSETKRSSMKKSKVKN